MGDSLSSCQRDSDFPYTNLPSVLPPYHHRPFLDGQYERFWDYKEAWISDSVRLSAEEMASQGSNLLGVAYILHLSGDGWGRNVEGSITLNRDSAYEDLHDWLRSYVGKNFGRHIIISHIDPPLGIREECLRVLWENEEFNKEFRKIDCSEIYFWVVDHWRFEKWEKSWKGKVEVRESEIVEFLDATCPMQLNRDNAHVGDIHMGSAREQYLWRRIWAEYPLFRVTQSGVDAFAFVDKWLPKLPPSLKVGLPDRRKEIYSWH